MAWETLLIITIVFIGLLILFLRTFVKSTVQESIKHQFEVERNERRQEFDRQMVDMRQNFEKNIFDIERKDKFKLAALEERLKAAQEAFELADLMFYNIYAQDKKEINERCQSFWRMRSLYLSNDVRQAYKDVMFWFSYMNQLKLMFSETQDKPTKDEIRKQIERAFEKIQNLPKEIEKSVDLEALSDEKVALKEKSDFLKEIDNN
jgi:hypothetical protein